MARVLRKILFSLSLILICGAATAQKVEFQISAPSIVAKGGVFRVEYSVNAKPERFIPPTFDKFDVVAGPTTSTSESTAIINGNMTRESRYSYTYVLIAQSEGNFTLPSAKVIVDGKEYSTKPLLIEAVDEGDAATQQGAGQTQGRETNGKAVTKIGDDDVFVRMIVDKTNVYKGEPIRAILKIYVRIPISRSRVNKMPAFNGFWKQELDVANYSVQRETYKSKVYETQILADYLLFPQQSGILQIEQADFTMTAQIVHQPQSRSLFDDFFGGMPQIEEVDKVVKTAPVSITVKDWPAGAPAEFNGAVGDFTMSSELSSDRLGANTSATYSIKISGAGNLPLIQAPKIELPSSFEQYNIKTSESLHSTASGISGYRQFEYPVIARAEGNFTMPAAKFSYFDPQGARYVTLSSESQSIVILPDSTAGSITPRNGMLSGFSKEDVKVLGQDIRFIKLGNHDLKLSDKLFMGSLGYWLIALFIVGLFLFILSYLQKRMKLMKDVNVMRWKRANKIALQRLKSAEGFMKEESQRGFYDEMLKALWGYMSDKLNIPVATLTKESVREELLKRRVSQDEVTKYVDLISNCEYAQYAPGESGQMHETYRAAVEIISKLESVIKK